MIGIARIDPKARNMLSVFQPDMLPGLAAVGCFIDSVAVGDIAAQTGLAGSNINHTRIRFENGDRADGGDYALVGDRLPAYAAVGGAPDASRNAAEIIGVGTARNSSYGEHAAAAIWADVAPLHPLKLRLIVGLRDR